MIEVTLRIQGVDLLDEKLDEVAANFPTTAWTEVGGTVLLTLFVDREDAASQTMDQIRKLEPLLPTMKVTGVDRDLVSVTEIGRRAGVTREAARKWTMADGFPAAFAYISTGSMKVWVWAQVAEWLEATRGLDFDEDLPTVEMMTQIENCIMRNPDHTTVQWHQLKRPPAARAPWPFNAAVAARPAAGGSAQGIVSKTYEPVGAAAR